MTIASNVADNLVSGVLHSFIWIGILILSIIPIARLLYKYLRRFLKSKQPGSDIPDMQQMIDLFDNDICYYVLMAESYADELRKIDKNTPGEVDKFYFIETCFYTNKAIYNLSLTTNVINRLYSDDVEELYKKRKISLTRLYNLFRIIDSIIEMIENYFDIISDIDQKQNYKELFSKYKMSYNVFRKNIGESYIQ